MKIRRRVLTVSLSILGIVLIVTFLGWSGLWIPNRPSQRTYPIRGIDVSHHQQAIHWDLVKASGIHFAYLKATEGADFKDQKFVQNWVDADTAGIARGAYHFFTLGTS